MASFDWVMRVDLDAALRRAQSSHPGSIFDYESGFSLSCSTLMPSLWDESVVRVGAVSEILWG